ncbi:MAG: helix-turn-helix domain-containing protein [Intrasporangium sp.]|uniref:helix-turn-helix domain-containing protein n=1 Tax=Intrasporangium sp. TaxID=1925024 RepID=UPI003F7CD774
MEGARERKTSTQAAEEGVGPQVARWRRARRLSQRALGLQAGVTASFLSQLENGRTNASLATLRRIATSLDVSMADLVEPGHVPAGRVLRREDRPRLTAAHGVTKWLAVRPPFGHVELYVVEFAAGASTGPDPYRHDESDEVLLCTAGTVTVELPDETHTLEAGDTIVFPSSVPHRLRNSGTVPAEVAWVLSPPTPGSTQPTVDDVDQPAGAG